MRYESSVTSISWIPSEAIPGITKMPFEVGLTHYDEPPPDQIDDLEALRVADRFRFARASSPMACVLSHGTPTVGKCISTRVNAPSRAAETKVHDQLVSVI